MKLIILPTVLIFTWSAFAQAGLYRWVDDNGKVYYGDRIPPAYAQSGHTELNKNGLTKHKVESAKARKKKIEALKLEKERQKILKAKKYESDLREMRDMQLRSMFSTVKELKRVYQSKLEMADGSIEILKVRHKKLSDSLAKLEARHERIVNPNDKNRLGMKIEDILDNLHIYQQAITENQIERKKIEENYRKDLARFILITADDKDKKKRPRSP
ncbi:MAG: hypothetical protein CSB47_09885 [Proteobacteria bacterium]|nr:MAG: hypothetical protein CSB47_09885 [Pseudomonadota bacterium]